MYRLHLAAFTLLPLLAACGSGKPGLGDIHFRSVAVKLAGDEGGSAVTVTLAWDAPADCSWSLGEAQVDLDGTTIPFDMMVTAPGQDTCPDTAMWKLHGVGFPKGPGDRTLTVRLDGASLAAVIPSPRDARHLSPSQPLTPVAPGGVLHFLPSRADTTLMGQSGPATLAPRDGGKRSAKPRSLVAPVGKTGVEVTIPAETPPGAYMLAVRAQATMVFPCFADTCTAWVTTKLVHALDLTE